MVVKIIICKNITYYFLYRNTFYCIDTNDHLRKLLEGVEQIRFIRIECDFPKLTSYLRSRKAIVFCNLFLHYCKKLFKI